MARPVGRRAPAPPKIQTSLYLDRSLRDRVDAVALVMPDSRAEVFRRAVEIGMVRLENDYRGQMAALLGPHAARFGLDIPTFAGWMAESGRSLADVARMDGFPE